MLNKIKINLSFLLISFIHFAISTFITWHSPKFSTQGFLIYSLLKALSCILIIIFWQSIPFIFNEIKKNNKFIKDFLKFFLIYFLINFIVLLLIWPGYTHSEFLNPFPGIKNNIIPCFWHFLSSLTQGTYYHIIPSIWGISLICIIVESIIVGYCIAKIKNNISNNYYFLLFIPFCIPAILILNTAPIRLIFTTWLSVIILFFIFINQNKKSNNRLHVFLLGMATGILVAFRSEYFPLLLFYPLTILTLKIFTRKNFLIYTLTFIFIFVSSHTIQKQQFGFTYELHNLAYIYEEIIDKNLNCPNLEEYKKELKKVFVDIDLQTGEGIKNSELNLKNETNNKKAIYILTKMLFENAHHFFKKNINHFTKEAIQITSKEFYIPEENPFFDRELKDFLNSEIKNINHTLRNNTIELLVYGNNKINLREYLYNPYINYSILLILAIYGLIKKKYFYIHYLMNISSILFVILLTMPWPNFLYLWSFFLNSYILLFLAIIEFLEKRKNN